MRDCGDDFDLLDFSAHFWCVENERRYSSVSFEDGVDEIDDEEVPCYASVRLIKDEE
jgi:hypothetical protein